MTLLFTVEILYVGWPVEARFRPHDEQNELSYIVLDAQVLKHG